MRKIRRKQRQGRTVDQVEYHLMGEIVGLSGIGEGVSLNYTVHFDASTWDLLDGAAEGQTHVAAELADGEDLAVLNHPIDVHFRANALLGAPRILLQAWRLDDAGRAETVGYGVAAMPLRPGRVEVASSLWRPVGTAAEELAAAFGGGAAARLRSDGPVLAEAWEKRLRLSTVAHGVAHLDVSVVVRNFDRFDVDM